MGSRMRCNKLVSLPSANSKFKNNSILTNKNPTWTDEDVGPPRKPIYLPSVSDFLLLGAMVGRLLVLFGVADCRFAYIPPLLFSIVCHRSPHSLTNLPIARITNLRIYFVDVISSCTSILFSSANRESSSFPSSLDTRETHHIWNSSSVLVRLAIQLDA